jgi:hypothetical protein
MHFSGRHSVILATLALALASPRANAQESSPIAESLFRDARARMSEGKTHEACELFQRSDKVQHALGTFLNLAACHEKEGKLSAAWAEFQEASAEATRAGDKERAAFAQDRVNAIDKALHKVVIDFASPPGDAKITVDGTVLDRAAWGTTLPLDPGAHTIQVTAEGYSPWEKKIDASQGGTEHVEVQLQRPEAAVPQLQQVDAVNQTKTHSLDPKLAGGIAALAVGAVSFGVAVGFGADMASQTSNRDKLCPPGQPCYTQAAFDADHAARIDQQWMFVLGGVGVAALGAGAVLVALSATGSKQVEKHGIAVQPWVSPVGGGLGLSGAW